MMDIIIFSLAGTVFIIHGFCSIFYPYQTRDYYEKHLTRKHQAPILFYRLTGIIALAFGSVGIYVAAKKILNY